MNLNELIRITKENKDIELKKSWADTLEDLRDYFKDGFSCDKCLTEFYIVDVVEYKKYVYLRCGCDSECLILIKKKNKWVLE